MGTIVFISGKQIAVKEDIDYLLGYVNSKDKRFILVYEIVTPFHIPGIGVHKMEEEYEERLINLDNVEIVY